MRVLLAPAVNSSDRSTSTIYTQNLCDLLKFTLFINAFFYLSYPNTLHPTTKFIIYQTILSNLSLFSKSRCPSMMVSIIEIVVYTKPTAELE